MKEIMFHGLNYIGNLYLAQEIMQYDCEPMIFVCYDNNNKLYLCIRISLTNCEWIVSEVSKDTIVKLIEEHIDTRKAITIDKNNIYIITMNKNNLFTTNVYRPSEINDGYLPRRGGFIKISWCEEGTKEFLSKIKEC